MYQALAVRLLGGMGHLRNLSRLLVGIAVALFAAFLLVPAAPVAATFGLVPSSAHVAPLTFPWTAALAAKFPGCREHLPAGQVASAFVVVRLSGTVERMAFDDAWARTHDRQAADDVWTVGQCAS